jgi:Xaa-Pro aminopeptidase
MKSDLDALMQASGIDALLVTGPGDHNPAMVYLTGRSDLNLTNADLIKLPGQAPVLFHADMERGEAARSGLPTVNLARYRLAELLDEAKGDMLRYSVARYRRMFQEVGLTAGRVALYGRIEAGAALAIFNSLQQAMPGLSFVPELGRTLLSQAMATKDEYEVERMRQMGRITTQVVGQTAEFLCAHAAQDGVLIQRDGRPLTIGDVKRRINFWLAEAGVENPEGLIFSTGYDSAIPHSSGAADDLLRLGQTIIFDIFPCEQGGGYYYDFTRTWCLGYASDEILRLYEDVLQVYRVIMSELKLGEPTRLYMQRACQLFEILGHPNVCSDSQAQKGFVHGLGHGIGLNVHEMPQFSLYAGPDERLLPGMVMTVEPGLYYPERMMGVRLEDTVWMRPDGQVEVLADYPLDLVLKVARQAS